MPRRRRSHREPPAGCQSVFWFGVHSSRGARFDHRFDQLKDNERSSKSSFRIGDSRRLSVPRYILSLSCLGAVPLLLCCMGGLYLSSAAPAGFVDSGLQEVQPLSPWRCQLCSFISSGSISLLAEHAKIAYAPSVMRLTIDWPSIDSD